MNYLLFYEQVEQALEEEMPSEKMTADISFVAVDSTDREARPVHTDIAARLSEWTAADGYLKPGLTIRELAETLQINRTYLSEYIKATYNLSFRDWITDLRLEYAKRQLLRHPGQNISEIAEAADFISPSHFTRIFKAREGISPSNWRKTQSGDTSVL